MKVRESEMALFSCVQIYVHTPELQYICETKKAKRRCLWEMDL